MTTRRWLCTVCGYIHEGDEPPDMCPVCAVPAEMFKAMDDAAEAPAPEPAAPAAGTDDPGRDRTVSDVMVETMVNWGVRHVFGMVGHSNLGLAEAIRRQEEAGKLSFIGIRHEGAGAFAASAYAKLTGKPAACMSIAGPGATNMLTGLWDAKVDRVPMLALTGQVETQVFGPGAFQELDLASAFSAATAWSQTVLATSRHAELMTLALKNAVLQRDVAHLIFPDEVQRQPVDVGAVASGPQGRLSALDIAPPAASLDAALARLRLATHPAVIVGKGAVSAMEPIVALAERLGCPVITTFKAKGQIPDDHPLACGVLGRSGTPVSAQLMNGADLLLVFGASFSKHTNITTEVPTIQVDFDPLTLGKFHAVDVPVLGEIGVTATLMGERLGDGGWQDRRAEIAEHRAKWREEKQRRAAKDQGKGLASAAVFESFGRVVADDAIIAVDVGNNTYSFGRYFECKRQPVLMSGYLGSIGFGYPAAMGAAAAAPDRSVVAITGDGGFAQYMGEMLTAVKYGMNITHVLLNNRELGKISLEQNTAGLPRWKTDLHNPDFSRYAENCGGLGIRVQNRDELDDALTRALEHDGPSMVEILTDPELV
jgi:pyruvate oxidase